MLELAAWLAIRFGEPEMLALHEVSKHSKKEDEKDPHHEIFTKINALIRAAAAQRKVAYEHARKHLLDVVQAFVTMFELDVKLPSQN